MRSDDRRVVVAIIGGGFSGFMLAAHLDRRGIGCVVVEERVAVGVAYATDEPRHLLNVAAGQMSAWADEPDHFASWFGTADAFAPRRDYRAYLQHIRAGLSPERVTVAPARAVGAERDADGGWTVRLDDGSALRADLLVLAQGNQPPEPLPGTEALQPPRYHNNPWTAAAEADLARAAREDRPVLLIGTGLTMIDSVLSLEAHGHRGTITAVSRRGLVPQSHRFDRRAIPEEIAPPPFGSLMRLWRHVRCETRLRDWRSCVDALRPHSHALWQSLSEADRRRFLRHARPWWDIHRHRIARRSARRSPRCATRDGWWSRRGGSARWRTAAT
ncbi:hypothetical protein HMF7854_14145 [Sphingomonas ginkgonis]|uniref:FAD-dependent urate hydroxylase HpyO/Asp monooxygenase CreE-like FAD/NAD(P)-binding domain-containing protein n=1 Tax=Sphingomonas ginkgonis TaxID=2315330 RepID=A0A3R9YKE3_9SPHN|nr:FAD/NAD(P)-binding protein [Sphingomonas ginkgonis]RST31850.1 hypothetical protein HMF7854_14145 [Sphingomonas ginkgonis]